MISMKERPTGVEKLQTNFSFDPVHFKNEIMSRFREDTAHFSVSCLFFTNIFVFRDSADLSF